ncbi:class I SAM-dependent methyltransferase [Sphingosinicella rhizophila]|uniref:class I SAM-dependent methyltransferase n=1 Tax=Sphingosinicella rhizophila TaxID=3050082 RepID=UPI0039656B4C
MVEPVRARKTVRILDVGGTAAYWRALPALYGLPGVEITVVNLDQPESSEANLELRAGNACDLPFADGTFDIVHSNSVIEHVGHWTEMERMAAEVRRLAPSHFIQTPNIGFPIEPHFKLPFVHWMPEQARIRALQMTGRLGGDIDAGAATRAVQRISLLSASQFSFLFPESRIWKERVAGFTKSLVAIR